MLSFGSLHLRARGDAVQVAFGALAEPVRAPEPWWAAAGQQAAAAQPCTPGAFPALPRAGPASEHSGLRQVPIIVAIYYFKSVGNMSY
jgi:hypothetical protein